LKQARSKTVDIDHARVSSDLIDWFLQNARDLPWRRTLDPYAIWVSEIMLQQTQVKTVIPYWEHWMKQLPTVARLATAKEDTLLKLWEGLGYYSRVRNLQKAAREIVNGVGGTFPEQPEAIRALPGVGRYTSGAIASIAFNQPEPILDGNVIRVLSRVFAVAGDPKEKQVNERLWALAKELVVRTKAGVANVKVGALVFAGQRAALNQGMMELGATVCLPTKPECERCPLRGHCRARVAGKTGLYPQSAKRAKSSARWFQAFVVTKAGKFLIRRRDEGLVNSGFWEFPGAEVADANADPSKAFRELFGWTPDQIEAFGQLRHSITRYRFHQSVHRVEWPVRRRMRLPESEWVTLEEIRRRPFYSPQLRLLKELE
jgi:A/G-specific adenine glycosylase